MADRHADAHLVASIRAVAPPRAGFHDGEVQWLGLATALRAFVDAHGRLPGSGDAAGHEERRLARWVKSQREAEHAGRLLARRAAWLDEWLPGWRSPRTQTWHTAAVAVGLHLARFGEYPSASAADPETRRLGTWLRTQRRARRAGRLAADREEWLALNLPYWDAPVAETWFGAAGLVADFVAEHERMPRADADPDEARLARWVRTQRGAERAGRLDDEQRAWLDATVPAWRSTRDAGWARAAREVACFRDEHGALPHSTGERPGEAQLSAWLGAQRSAAANGSLSADRRAWLDEHLTGWAASRADRWPDRLAETAAFVARHSRLPARAGDADDDERRIASWLGAQRRADRDGQLSDERRARLDANVPGWSATGETAWRGRAQQLAAFVAEHGRLPAVREVSPEARGLAVWLGRQRALAAEGRLDAPRERWLRLHVPGWRDHHLGAWLGTAERVVAFRAEHGRLPTRSTSATPFERELGVWLNNQRNAGRDGRLCPERLRWLGEQLPDWDDSRLGAWLTRAQEVERYTDEHGRMPHPRSTNPRSRRLGGWLESQRVAARAGKLRANRIDWLDAHLPGWNESVSRRTGHRVEQAAAGRPAAEPAERLPRNDQADRVLREWGARLRARPDLPLRAEQRAWLARTLPGWDQQSA
jgi:hypothetical protein